VIAVKKIVMEGLLLGVEKEKAKAMLRKRGRLMPRLKL
jgi:hypothetical protein